MAHLVIRWERPPTPDQWHAFASSLPGLKPGTSIQVDTPVKVEAILQLLRTAKFTEIHSREMTKDAITDEEWIASSQACCGIEPEHGPRYRIDATKV
jgi:hypothetical protein